MATTDNNYKPAGPAMSAEQEAMLAQEQKTARTQSIIAWGVIIAAAIVVVILVYIFAIRRPGIAAADQAIAQADMSLSLGQDSLALAQYKQVADNYGYDAGNRAKLQTAIILYGQAAQLTDKTERDAKLNEAIKYCSDYSASDEVIAAAAKSLEGDCYVNLGQLDKAVACYEKAIAISAGNPYYTPLFMMKEATVQRELKNYAAEQKLYEQIQEKYPAYGQTYSIDIEKYIERAKAQDQAE